MIHRTVNESLLVIMWLVHEVIEYCKRHMVQKRIVSQHCFVPRFVRLLVEPSNARSAFAERIRQWKELSVLNVEAWEAVAVVISSMSVCSIGLVVRSMDVDHYCHSFSIFCLRNLMEKC